MDSKIAKAIKLKNQPIAVYRTDIKEDNALQFKEGVWGCVIAMLNVKAKQRFFHKRQLPVWVVEQVLD